MIKWSKIGLGNFATDLDKIYIIPKEDSGCSVFYFDEVGTVTHIQCQELVDKLKTFADNKITINNQTIAEVKDMIEKAVKEINYDKL